MPLEPRYLQRAQKPVSFFGWEFDLVPLRSDGSGTLLFWGELLNPEAPGLIQSYRNFNWLVEGHPASIKWAAAWLTSHWYEHALNICECLGNRGSMFRQAFIATILHLES